jgi:hypothetical protein
LAVNWQTMANNLEPSKSSKKAQQSAKGEQSGVQ